MAPSELLKTRPANLPWWVELLVAALMSLAGTLYIESTHNDAATALRVSGVEARLSASEATQKSEGSKVDHIQTQVDRLVEWALGKK